MSQPSGSTGEAARPALQPVLTGPLPHRVKGAVLLLHGGRADALQAPPKLNLPALRMRPFGMAIARATAHDDILVAHIRYTHRGWNGHHAHPVADVHRALAELRGQAGAVPVVLVGHSLGGRAALRAAADPHVKGVIVLAPWCPSGEPAAHLRGRAVIALHDEADRVTSATDTWAYLTRAQGAGARVEGIRMPLGGHTMIRAARRWHRATAEATVALLGLASRPDPVADGSPWTGRPRPL